LLSAGPAWLRSCDELHGRRAQLPELADEITYVVLTPYLGAARATAIAGTPATVA